MQVALGILIVGNLGVPPILLSATPSITTFHCINYGKDFATVARKMQAGKPFRQTPPFILWTQEFGKYAPQERCKIVSDRLTEAVAQNGAGKLINLEITHGRLNNESVICFVTGKVESKNPCKKENLLFTLLPSSRGKESEILESIVIFTQFGSVKAIEQSPPYQPLISNRACYENSDKLTFCSLWLVDAYFANEKI